MSRRSSDRHDQLFRVIVSVLLISGAVLVLAILAQSRMERAERFRTVYATQLPTDAPTVAPENTVAPNADAAADDQEPENAVPTAEPLDELLTGEAVTLPVFSRAETREHKVAITIDSIGSPKYLKMLIELTKQFDTRFTLFPTGSAMTGGETSTLIATCVDDYGYEIENRTWNNKKLYALSDLEMAKDIWGTEVALEYALNRAYDMRFIRTNGGQNADDPRTCAYLKKLGYEGFVTWSVIGSIKTSTELESGLGPGQIYLFNCTEDDMMKLAGFLRYLRDRHYDVVTLSELLGYETPTPKDYDGDLMAQLLPYPDDFTMANVDFSAGMRAYQVLLIQRRLAELGYLAPSSADGVYGESTTRAIMALQSAHGEAATGIASHDTQNLLFSDAAKAAKVRVTDAPTATPTPVGYATPMPTEEGATLPPDSVTVPNADFLAPEPETVEDDDLIFSLN